MRIWKCALIPAIMFVIGMLPGCQETPAGPVTRAYHSAGPSCDGQRGIINQGIGVRRLAKIPAGITGQPDFTEILRDMVPGQIVKVYAYRINATTWWVELEVLDCNSAGGLCRALWVQYIYTVPPTDPGFVISIREALDTDGDGRWNWQEGPAIDYQQ